MHLSMANLPYRQTDNSQSSVYSSHLCLSNSFPTSVVSISVSYPISNPFQCDSCSDILCCPSSTLRPAGWLAHISRASISVPAYYYCYRTPSPTPAPSSPPQPPCHIDILRIQAILLVLPLSQECRSLPQPCSMRYIRITIRVSLTSWMQEPVWSSILGLTPTSPHPMVAIMAEPSIRIWRLGPGSMPGEEPRMAVLFYGSKFLIPLLWFPNIMY